MIAAGLIEEVTQRAAAQRPALASRMQRAAMLLEARALTYSTGQRVWKVRSQSAGGVVYTVATRADGHTASCQCQDCLYQAPKGWCKHRLAVELALAVDHAQAERQQAQTGNASR
jgi:hypothetical protein